MAKGASPAKRTNRVLVSLAFLAVVGASVAAAFGSGPNASSTSTTTPSAPSSNDIPGARPAETALSWFDHGFAVEQFDYEMDELSCEAVEKTITPDLCAVVGSGDNAFMMVGAEGYWDPLAGLVDHVISEGFADASLRDYISIDPDVAALETTLRAALS